MVTHSKSHKNRAVHMMRTWLSQVENLVVLSDVADLDLGSVPINFDGPQSYDNLWNILQGAYSYLYTSYFADSSSTLPRFEWLALVTDDAYCLPENVEALINLPHIQEANNKGQPIYLGRELSTHIVDPSGDFPSFVSGGSLRLFNMVALQKLYKEITTSEWCSDNVFLAEDLHASRCLALAGVQPWESRDSALRDRFHV